ncbi:ABC-F type ribosomal protection protein [Lachnospiraceae bacterium 62-35]
MSLIQVSNLTFAYEQSYDNIFENVNFQIDTDWRLGFTGRNGRGKTTFLKLLLGEYEYKGKISASVKFEYFPYPVKDEEQLTLDIALEQNPVCELWELQKELFQLEVREDVLYRPFSTLSYGERTKVLLAVLFLKENAFLLIDEPTNHLDLEAREAVGAYLSGKKGFILVSHDRTLLNQCTNYTLAINKADIQVQKGNFDSWYENKQRQDEYEFHENEKLKKDIRRLSESAKKTGQWADYVESTKIGKKAQAHGNSGALRAYIGEKSRRMQQRRKNLEKRQEKAIEDKKKLLKNIEEPEALKMLPECHHGEILVSFRQVSLGYPYSDREKEKQFQRAAGPLNFSVMNGERVVLEGGNGCGKSSVLKLLLQAIGGTETDRRKIWYEGTVTVANGLKISYVPQSAEGLEGSLQDFAVQWDLDWTLFLAILRKLDFSRVQFEKQIEDFSQGQKKKVLLAKSLCEKAHLYVWDEPLNYMDIFTRIQLEELILAYKPSMLFVEHDRAFSDRIATKRIQL